MLKNIFAILLITLLSYSQSEFNFYSTKDYKTDVKKPEHVLEFAIGDRPIRYSEAVEYFMYLEKNSDRAKLDWRGKTHQGRKLYYLIISSEKNITNLAEINKNIRAIADPRKTEQNKSEELISKTPLVAMMMYSIHGNELSGADASIQLAYQLAAGEDEYTKNLLENLVVIIYPMENPDGRERFLSDREQWIGEIPTDDTQSLPHSGTWPTGRTNHYHFDLNRDWFILSQPESRSRVSIMMEWLPQLVIDAHEMGSFSTFLMNPPREPINPFVDSKIRNWWNIFAKEQAKELDKYGWSYYTGEWLEDWYPGYGSSYPGYFGAVSILYEQARTAGLNVKRPDGNILTFVESVHHQYASSLANLNTAANNKNELIQSFYEIRKAGLKSSHPGGVQAYVFETKNNKTRVDSLMKILEFQGIEIFEATEDFEISKVRNYYEDKSRSRKFEKGSYIISLSQPHQDIIKSVLDFDTRLKSSFLKTERESLLKGNGSELYEVTAWSLPLSFAVESYASFSEPDVPKVKISFDDDEEVSLISKAQYGYLISYEDDNVIIFLKELLAHKLKVRSASKKFKIEDNEYTKGTLLLRKEENPNSLEKLLTDLAEKYSIKISSVNTALAQNGADLGGSYFDLLTPPKVAFLVGQNSSMYNFGELWYLLDNRIGLKTSMLKLDYLNYYDLRKYNVLIIPSGWGKMKNDFNKSNSEKLKSWVKEGGTLIAIDNAIAVLSDSSVGISSIKPRRNNIKKINDYYKLIAESNALENIQIDSTRVWDSGEAEFESITPVMTIDEQREAKRDSDYIKFMPQGTILNIKLDTEHWLTRGLQNNIPAFYSSSYSFFSINPKHTVGRFESPKNIRLSGLLWPEAKHRLAYAGYLMREKLGNGQIISFADSPFFRAQYLGTARLFLNAVFLGPGIGANQSVEF